jgi:hypothetical protein
MGIENPHNLTWRNRMAWFVLVSFFVVIIGGWIHQAIQRPFTAVAALVLFFALIWYWSTEDTSGSMLHSHSEFEVVFWSAISFYCGLILFGLPDSPLVEVIQFLRQKLTDLFTTGSSVVSRHASIADQCLSLGWSLVFAVLVSYATLNVARAKHRRELTQKPEVFLRRLSSSLLASSTSDKRITVKETLAQLEEAMDQLDHDYLPSSIARLISFSKKLLAEAKIVRIFKEAGVHHFMGNENSNSAASFTPEEYSYVILKCDLALILYKVKDHSVAAHRTQLIRVLSEQRLPLLTTAAKAMILHCLQQIKISSNRQCMERAAVNLIRSTFGHELTELKAIMDSKGNYHSLHKLVFHDIKTLMNRKIIIDHMLNESKLITASERERAATAAAAAGPPLTRQFSVQKSRSLPVIDLEEETPPLERVESFCVEYGKPKKLNPYIFNDGTTRRLIQAKTKIVSDIDDTFLCSGGMYPAGVDRRYGRKIVYPGVGAFYRELDLSGSGDLNSNSQITGWPVNGEIQGVKDLMLGNLVFLSARPHIYKDIVESQEYQKYRNWKRENVLHCTPMLLPGSLLEGSEFVLRGKLEALADKKAQNLKEYAQLYPEYGYIFIGDNGQADVRAVSKLLDVPYINIRFAYIHQVQEKTATFGLPEDEKLDKIVFFTNYAQAALHAFKNGFLSAPGLARVLIATVTDWEAISDKEKLVESTKADLTDSIKEALAYLDFCKQRKTNEWSEEIWKFLESANIRLPAENVLVLAK